MINEFFTSIQGIIILYIPTILNVLSTIINYVVLLKGLKKVDVKTPLDVQSRILSTKIGDVKNQLEEQKIFMSEQADKIVQLELKLAENYSTQNKLMEKIEEQNKVIIAVTQRNVDLNATIRSKENGANN